MTRQLVGWEKGTGGKPIPRESVGRLQMERLKIRRGLVKVSLAACGSLTEIDRPRLVLVLVLVLRARTHASGLGAK